MDLTAIIPHPSRRWKQNRRPRYFTFSSQHVRESNENESELLTSDEIDEFARFGENRIPNPFVLDSWKQIESKIVLDPWPIEFRQERIVQKTSKEHAEIQTSSAKPTESKSVRAIIFQLVGFYLVCIW